MGDQIPLYCRKLQTLPTLRGAVRAAEGGNMMSILIKGMEMPFCCLVCPCSGTDDKEVWVCEASELRRLTTEDKIECRPEWCPLVSVPPHGRLIDADVLKSGINEAMKSALKGDAVTVYGVALAGFVAQGFIEEIENAPTVIEAEEGE
jgi:hypothetical protein